MDVATVLGSVFIGIAAACGWIAAFNQTNDSSKHQENCVKPKYRIVRVGVFKTLFSVQKKVWWGWKTVLEAQAITYCEQYCENATNPIVKEY